MGYGSLPSNNLIGLAWLGLVCRAARAGVGLGLLLAWWGQKGTGGQAACGCGRFPSLSGLACGHGVIAERKIPSPLTHDSTFAGQAGRQAGGRLSAEAPASQPASQ